MDKFDISIHAPHAGSDIILALTRALHKISIHAPHAGSDVASGIYSPNEAISIHAPHAGSDWLMPSSKRAPLTFQSTLPMRGATCSRYNLCHYPAISIHAPHAGSDADRPLHLCQSPDFNPRSPCGERRRGVTKGVYTHNFNPRSPCGERPYGANPPFSVHPFQSTLPMRGATIWSTSLSTFIAHFNPRSPCGERLVTVRDCGARLDFNPRSPCGERLRNPCL